MSVHQIIYTSCMRGMKGVNDGQQVFSYDAQFQSSAQDEIKNFFFYQQPALESGTVMTEEIARTLPRSFTYRKLSNSYALAQSTYLGRDYMGSTGRFGNFLSHVVVADGKEMGSYPCEYFGSNLLRTEMDFEEVNNPNPPEFLPTPRLSKGSQITAAKVLDFLGEGNRLEIYKNMLFALLSFESQRKRVVICDKPECIILWIAALEYALPLENALSINFTTYEFDPSLSESQICGVVPFGTKYTPDSEKLHFTFDLFQNRCVEFEKEKDFYDFVDTAFSFSFDILQDFHQFLENSYTYEKADHQIYDGYTLYRILFDGMDGISGEKLCLALDFAEKYAWKDEKISIRLKLLSYTSQLLLLQRDSFVTTLHFLLQIDKKKYVNEFETLKQIIVDRVLGYFLEAENSETDFNSFYDEISIICKENQLSLATELMLPSNRQKLLGVMERNVKTWKIAFVIQILSTYVRDNGISVANLTPETELGNLYYTILKTVYQQNEENGFYLVSCVLDEFYPNCTYMVEMAFHMEGILLDFPNSQPYVSKLWDCFREKLRENKLIDISVAYTFFETYDRFEQIYGLYGLELQEVKSVLETEGIFQRHFKKYVLKEREYAHKFQESIALLYYSKLNDFPSKNLEGKRNLFELLYGKELYFQFSSSLVKDLLGPLPLGSLTAEQHSLVEDCFKYCFLLSQEPLYEKLLLLLIGTKLERATSVRQREKVLEQLGEVALRQKVTFGKLKEKAIEDYFAWVIHVDCTYLENREDLFSFYQLFDLSVDLEKQMIEEIGKISLKQCKEDKNNDGFTEYFAFVCELEDKGLLEVVAKVLKKQNKARQDGIFQSISSVFKRDKKKQAMLLELQDMVKSSNPLLNNISNLFKNKNKDS